MARILVLGDDLVVAAFAEAAATVNDRLQDAAEPVAEAIADTQKTLFSQQYTDRTGATARSITAEKGEDDGVLWTIGPETFYSRFGEDGTARQPPRPFVGPSGEIHADDYLTVARDVAADV